MSPPRFVEEMRLAAALKWYESGMLSQSKAASVAGVSREAFLLAAGRFQVSAVQSNPVELAEELSRDGKVGHQYLTADPAWQGWATRMGSRTTLPDTFLEK